MKGKQFVTPIGRVPAQRKNIIGSQKITPKRNIRRRSQSSVMGQDSFVEQDPKRKGGRSTFSIHKPPLPHCSLNFSFPQKQALSDVKSRLDDLKTFTASLYDGCFTSTPQTLARHVNALIAHGYSDQVRDIFETTTQEYLSRANIKLVGEVGRPDHPTDPHTISHILDVVQDLWGHFKRSLAIVNGVYHPIEHSGYSIVKKVHVWFIDTLDTGSPGRLADVVSAGINARRLGAPEPSLSVLRASMSVLRAVGAEDKVTEQLSTSGPFEGRADSLRASLSPGRYLQAVEEVLAADAELVTFVLQSERGPVPCPLHTHKAVSSDVDMESVPPSDLAEVRDPIQISRAAARVLEHSEAARKVRRALETAFLSRHRSVLDPVQLRTWMEAGEMQSISLVFRLFAREGGPQAFCECLGEAISGAVRALDDLPSLLRLRRTLHQLVHITANHRVMSVARDSFRASLAGSTGESLAHLLHSLLQGGEAPECQTLPWRTPSAGHAEVQKSEDDTLRGHLNGLLTLFLDLPPPAKQAFHRLHSLLLASRLLSPLTSEEWPNIALERTTLNYLAAECGESQLSHLSTMLEDAANRVDDTIVLNPAAWPNEMGIAAPGPSPAPSPALVLPPAVQEAQDRWMEQWAGENPTKKAAPVSSLSQASLTASLGGRAVRVICPGPSACLLSALASEEEGGTRVDAISELIGIPADAVRKLAFPLLQSGLLVDLSLEDGDVLDGAVDIEVTDHLAPSGSYSGPSEVVIPFPLPIGKPGASPGEGPRTQHNLKVHVSAAIAAVLKRVGRMSVPDLLSRVSSQLKTEIAPSLLKERIAALIEQELLTRNDDEANILEYIQ
eukprot:gnl/Dysnectes_brevis/1534_a1742_1055.p1 GENE.gnl/Dysnectes_brevis/1534_a1742_1055~~gnl/Dysnectes_brevis/1534_a1742_1055.p1  ORF type:complete len:841 (+),score=272.53 gnl/Dysnectes_brevis/1534_a1742_1055:2025-4547(+)